MVVFRYDSTGSSQAFGQSDALDANDNQVFERPGGVRFSPDLTTLVVTNTAGSAQPVLRFPIPPTPATNPLTPTSMGAGDPTSLSFNGAT